MFAVVKTGGKQYKVTPGDVLLVEKLQGEEGDNIVLSDVLLVSDDKETVVGSPNLEKASVKATIREQTRGDKIIVFKKKRRQGYRRTAGHRQDVTVLTIDEITMGSKSAKKSVEKKAPKPKAVSPEKSATEPVKKAAAPKKATSDSAAEKKAATKSVKKTETAVKKTKTTAKPTEKTAAKAAEKKAPAKKAPAKKAAESKKKETTE